MQAKKMISPNRKKKHLTEIQNIQFRGRMDNEMSYTYDVKLEENILVVGRTGCGKTTFV